MPILPEDREHDTSLFPVDARDVNAQQLDLRRTNSWVLKLEQIQTPEVAEVFAINALSPFIINGHLKHVMMRDPGAVRRQRLFILR